MLTWGADPDLVEQVRNTTSRHLLTYQGDPERLVEDVRHETSVLDAAYRRRQVIELIQNGADALLDTEGGRIEVRLDPGVLYVANEGRPLSSEGLNSLLYIRLSEKAGKEIGRLGVGFKSVLEVTDRPYLLSRSVSLSFDRQRTVQMLREHLDAPGIDAVPVMRFGEVVDDPCVLTGEFPALEELLDWASTVVVLPLMASGLEWLAGTLTQAEFPNEFLLFSPHVSSVVIDDRVTGFQRTVQLTRFGDDLILEDDVDAEQSRWRVRSRTATLSETAQHDGGRLFERAEVDLAWALPLEVERPPGDKRAPRASRPPRAIWSFFPVEGVSSTLPGILNSAWKLSEDRSNLVAGDFNEFLLKEAAQLVLSTLSEGLPEDRPGRALELLPPPPVEAGRGRSTETGWVARFLQEEIWGAARASAVVPAVDGSWHRGNTLRLWPDWIRRPGMAPIQDHWLAAVQRRDRWVHQSVMTEERVRRARALGADHATVVEWLESTRSPEDRLGTSRSALALATMVWDHSETGDSSPLLQSRIVHTEGGAWASIAECRLDDDAPPDTRPARGTRELVRALHRRAGISENIGERLLVDLVEKSATGKGLSDEDTEAFWSGVHSIGAKRALRALRGVGDLSNLRVRTASGSFRRSGQVLLAGELVDPESDSACCVDPEFHALDGDLLDRIGVSSVPGWSDVLPLVERGPLDSYLWSCDERWREMLHGGSNPNPVSGSAWVEPVRSTRFDPFDEAQAPAPAHRFMTHANLFLEASELGRARMTRFVMSSEGWHCPWRVRHRTVKSYPALQVESPSTYLIVHHGRLESSAGSISPRKAFGSAFTEWQDVLPVVQLSAEAAAALELDGDVPTTLADRWSPDLFDLIASAADEAEDGRAVGLLRIAAEQHLPLPEGVELPFLTDRVAEAVEHREQGERVWVCAPEILRVWPPGWEFPGIERPPAEPVGDVEITTLDEFFPALATRLGDGSIQVWECDRVVVQTSEVDFGRRGDSFLVAGGVEPELVLEWLVAELLPDATPEQRSELVAQQVDAVATRLIEAVREQSDDVGRLVALLGPDELDAACEELVRWPVGGSPEHRAAVLLALHGPATLKMVRSRLPSGLGVPHQWAGGDRVRAWVDRLGFDAEFAGRRKAERQDAERVDGPLVVGELHDFQREIADRVLEILAGHSKGIVDLPTGAGKTRVAIESLLDHAERHGELGTVLWIAEREELCEQAVTQWLQLWRARGLVDRELNVLRYFGGRAPQATPSDTDTVVVASRQQAITRLGQPQFEWLSRAGVVVIDEAHHSTARTYRQLVRWRKSQGAEPFTVLGLSATPFRSNDDGSAQLARLFDRSLVTGSMMGKKWKRRIKWLQDHEYLSKVEWRDLELGEVQPTVDEERYLTEQANLNTGIDQLNGRLGLDSERNRQILGSIRDMDPEWPVVVFAGSVVHAQLLAVMLNDHGISARPIWGELTQWARRHAIEEFRSKRVRVLTNFNVLSEGFDAPQTRAVVIARLVQSDGLFLQMLGRGMRGPRNGGTDECLLVTTGERLPDRLDPEGNLDVERHEYLWSPR